MLNLKHVLYKIYKIKKVNLYLLLLNPKDYLKPNNSYSLQKKIELLELILSISKIFICKKVSLFLFHLRKMIIINYLKYLIA